MKWAAWAIAITVGLAMAWIARPLGSRGLGPEPRPARDFGEALALVARLRAADTAAISPECRTLFLSHGHRTARVIVLLHGLTNCPAQFDSLARGAFARGANVL